ncbi:hypothetical protein [Lentzea sp. NPDC059081]
MREHVRDLIPGASHVEGTARVQTVDDRQVAALPAAFRARKGRRA